MELARQRGIMATKVRIVMMTNPTTGNFLSFVCRWIVSPLHLPDTFGEINLLKQP